MLTFQHNFFPVERMVQELRRKFGPLALFFYNDLTPEVVAVLWRPTCFIAQPFGAMNSEFARPVDDDNWKTDSMVLDNMKDLLRELSMYTADIVVGVKLIDDRSVKRKILPSDQLLPSKTKRKPAVSEYDDSDNDSSDEIMEAES